MQPDGEIIFGHLAEQRTELDLIKRAINKMPEADDVSIATVYINFNK